MLGMAWPVLRPLAAELGRLMVEVGTFIQPDDVYHMYTAELDEAMTLRAGGKATPALGELAAPESWPTLPSPNLVIAGTRGLSWSSPPSWCFALARLFKSDESHDGTISVTETSHHDVDEHQQVHAGHSTIMTNEEVIELVVDWVSRHG